ncbi:hypothetical protein V502_11503 [Pseudogymnoascus sp. VKM F-4520 (FW-2644)]|nr:hypothetical protein V502_11503 [Pseudogymnoascus sp. VKM F-4520 (FW-2644)]
MSSNQGYSIQAESPPNLHIPPSDRTVSVFLVDSGIRVGAPRGLLVIPTYKGAEGLMAPAYSFLVSHPSGKRIHFDLGVRKDWQSAFPPSVLQEITNPEFGITAVQTTDVPEALVQGGIRLDDINQILWSHHHWDHVGDPTLFPTTTDLVVGPGFKEAFGPGWPSRDDAPVKTVDWEGRNLIEHDFKNGKSLKIGRFSALDYWGDGSFYVLDTPGHALGHVSALARVGKDEFVFLGGDVAHHPGEFRPSPYVPLPATISPSPFPDLYPESCPGTVFASIKPDPLTPFYHPAEPLAYDIPLTVWSIEGLKEFDASENILVVVAHDASLLPESDEENTWLFPQPLTGWKKAGLKEKVKWRFLKDFKTAIQTS